MALGYFAEWNMGNLLIRMAAATILGGVIRSVGFAAALEKAMAEEQPMTCHTVTYNAARELRTFYYRPSREYTL